MRCTGFGSVQLGAAFSVSMLRTIKYLSASTLALSIGLLAFRIPVAC